MKLYLEECAIFAAVVEHGGFSAAARHLGASKATISQQIARLEDGLQAQLLYRSTRSLALTAAGQQVLQQCQDLARLGINIRETVESLRTEPAGHVRITAPYSFGELFLSDIVDAFQGRFPGISVSLELENTYTDLKSTKADIAIRNGLTDDPDQVALPIAQYYETLVASPGFAESIGELGHPTDLTSHPCLVNDHACKNGQWLFSDAGDQENWITVAVSGPVSMNQYTLIRTAALTGKGIARLPWYLAAPEIQAGRLVSLLEDFLSPRTPVFLVYTRESHRPLRVRLLVDFIRDWFARTT